MAAEEKTTEKALVLRAFYFNGKRCMPGDEVELPLTTYRNHVEGHKVVSVSSVEPQHHRDIAVQRERWGVSEKAVSSKRAGAERAAS